MHEIKQAAREHRARLDRHEVIRDAAMLVAMMLFAAWLTIGPMFRR